VAPRLTVVPDDGADPDAPDDPHAVDDEASELVPGWPADGTAPSGITHDAAWFEGLVRDNTAALHRYLVRRVGVSDADDLAADVLVVAWRRRDDVPDEVPLAWLYRTAGYVVANFRRKGRPIPVGDVPDDATDDDPAVQAVRDEQVREVAHFGLARGVLDHGLALREHGGHQQVLRPGDGDHVGDDARALQALRARLDEAVLDVDLGAHRLQALDVLVHGARADRAAARQRHLRLAKARDERPEYEDRRTHGLHELIRRDEVVHLRGVELHVRAVLLGTHAHLAQQLERGAHVLEVGHVVEMNGFRAQKACAENGQRRILCTGNSHFPCELLPADDDEFIHA